MELSWLNTFITAAEEENFRRAADRLHVAQSTVTLHIQNIEDELETRLFDRIGRSVQLNPTGLGFLQYAKSIMENYNESIEYVARRLQGYQETIKISVSTLVATTALPRWIREFRKVSPETEFSIEVTDSSSVVASVMNQECDIGIGRIPIVQEQMESIELYNDPIVFVGPSGIGVRNGREVSTEDIFRENLLFTYNHPLYWDDLLFQLRCNVPNVRTMKVSKVHVSVEWIKEGMGISFLPVTTVKDAVEKGQMDMVPFPYFSLPSAHTYLLKRKNQNQTINSFIELISNTEFTSTQVKYGTGVK
ncbi:LysR family transcriptional regulator [Alicyclobacillus fastidiosus]|uniref:LysR family transcriptional regulator n=1 Tax=Alicyclobacillus fastidiosus TaxID=392011 RepID=A0ABY6ZJW2_9BACL|nr:LysR family transcriptional regulator [Alicyclobacillus fastidiosus]WAH43075.1 LysR family transcriptional regulator [Alicyclobacillus fastidiosus]GMA65063.1 HTH-type transcriptional regulator CitR [Alicyclobacillus fastidiosus]